MDRCKMVLALVADAVEQYAGELSALDMPATKGSRAANLGERTRGYGVVAPEGIAR